MDRNEKKMGWAILILMAICAALGCYAMPLPMGAGFVAFFCVCFAICWVYESIPVEGKEK